jgi:uroporphyrinogen-III synthase
VTRAEEPGGPLSRRLERRGARVLHWQAIEIAPAEDPRPLREAVAALARYDWLVFASAHAVAAVVAALGSPSAASPRVAAVGPETAAAAERAGFRVVHSPAAPARAGAAALLAELAPAGGLAGARVLLPASAIARPELAAGLEALGATVDRVEAYRTRPAPLDAARCRAQLAAGEVDAVLFSSPSAVASLARAFGPPGLAPALAGRRVVSIGPTTSRALRDLGLPPSAEARASTLDGLVAATVRAAAEPSQ